MPTVFLCHIRAVEQEDHGLFLNYANLVVAEWHKSASNGVPPWSWLRGYGKK